MKLAMINADKMLKNEHPDAHMLLQIHDSIVVECPVSKAAHIGESLKQIMEAVYKLPVRLDVDVTVGDNWGQL
jgi:DNA polymerase-1